MQGTGGASSSDGGTQGVLSGAGGGGSPPISPPGCDSITLKPSVMNPCGRTPGIAYSPNGELLATATEDRATALHVFRLSDGKRAQDFPDTANIDAYSVAFSPDSKLVALGGMGDFAAVFDVQSGARVQRFSANTGGYVSSVAFSNDGSLLATSGENGPVELWRIADGTRVTAISHAGITVHNVHFAPSGAELIAGITGVKASVYSVPDGAELFSVGPIAAEMGDATFSPDGTQIVSTGDDDTPSGQDSIKIWDVATRSLLQSLKGHQAYVSHVLFVDQDNIVSNDWKGLIKRWSRQSSGQFADAGEWQTPGQSLGIAVSPDKRTLAAGTGPGPESNGVSEGFVFLSLYR
jgi:WD40 repeat protein